MLDFPGKTLKFIAKQQARLIKKHLKKQEAELDKNLKTVEEDDPAKSPALAEPSEPGTDSYIADTHSKNQVIVSQLIKMKNSIRATLAKFRLGTYGKCEVCSKQIEKERLLVLPTAQYCLTCSKKTSAKIKK